MIDQTGSIAALNFWHQAKKLRDQYLKANANDHQGFRCLRDGMTGSEAMEELHRLIEEFEEYINPPAKLLEYEKDE